MWVKGCLQRALDAYPPRNTSKNRCCIVYVTGHKQTVSRFIAILAISQSPAVVVALRFVVALTTTTKRHDEHLEFKPKVSGKYTKLATDLQVNALAFSEIWAY